VRLEVGERLAFEIGVEAFAALWGTDFSDAFGQGPGSAILGETKDLMALQDQVDGAAETGPELDLSCDGSLKGLGG
jgi:hypothetical protein